MNSAGEKRRLRYQVAKAGSQETSTTPPVLDPNIPFEPRKGQRSEVTQSFSLVFVMFQTRGVLGGTTVAGDVVPQSCPVMKERETVTDLGTEVNMTAMLAARETWCVAVTTASSSDNIIIPKMTAVRDQPIPLFLSLHSTLLSTAFIQHSLGRSVRKTCFYVSIEDENKCILKIKCYKITY